MNRRAFLQVLAASATAFAIDPATFLPAPVEAKVLYLPEQDIVVAKSIPEALSRSLVGVWPGGVRVAMNFNPNSEIIRDHYRMTFEEFVNHEIQAILASGGRVVPNRQWRPYELWASV